MNNIYQLDRFKNLTNQIDIRNECIQQLSVIGQFNYTRLSQTTLNGALGIIGVNDLQYKTDKPLLSHSKTDNIISIRAFQKIKSDNKLQPSDYVIPEYEERPIKSTLECESLDQQITRLLLLNDQECFLKQCGYTQKGHFSKTNHRVKGEHGYFYLYKYLLANGVEFIKYGISYNARNSNRRADQCTSVNNRKGVGILERTLIMERRLPHPLPEDLELFIKRRIPTAIISKDDFPDGWTETCKVFHQDWLVSLLTQTYKNNKIEEVRQ